MHDLNLHNSCIYAQKKQYFKAVFMETIKISDVTTERLFETFVFKQ